jgi:hypothetical protein
MNILNVLYKLIYVLSCLITLVLVLFDSNFHGFYNSIAKYFSKYIKFEYVIIIEIYITFILILLTLRFFAALIIYLKRKIFPITGGRDELDG